MERKYLDAAHPWFLCCCLWKNFTHRYSYLQAYFAFLCHLNSYRVVGLQSYCFWLNILSLSWVYLSLPFQTRSSNNMTKFKFKIFQGVYSYHFLVWVSITVGSGIRIKKSWKHKQLLPKIDSVINFCFQFTPTSVKVLLFKKCYSLFQVLNDLKGFPLFFFVVFVFKKANKIFYLIQTALNII